MVPDESEKYPAESGRRRFVKGVVGASVLAGAGTGAAGALGMATSAPGAGGGTVEYVGIENTDGPAPRAMPQIPLTIDDEGYLKGRWPPVKEKEVEGQTVTVAETEIAGLTYTSQWFQYCGVQSVPGAQPTVDQDNYFRASSSLYEWQQAEKETGDRFHVDDFTGYEEWGNGIGESGLGKPGAGTWRSVDVSPQDVMPVRIIRSTRIEELAGSDHELGDWLAETTERGIMAWLDKCTHFCCVPEYKAFAGSAKFDGEDAVYCQCHQSVYDPFSPVKWAFTALPRPESVGGSGGGTSGGGENSTAD